MKFVSDAERKQAERDKARVRAEKDNIRKIKHAANDDAAVMMSDTNRAFVESVLSTFFKAQDEAAVAAAVSGEADALAGAGAGAGTGAAADAPPPATQEEIKATLKKLRKLGFTADQAQLAVERTGGANIDDALDYLCLNLPESQLPKQFDPRGKQLDVLVPLSDDADATASLDPAVQRLMVYGFRASDAQQALGACGGDVFAACRALHQALCATAGVAAVGPPAAPTATPDDETDEELTMLEAIYGDDSFSCTADASGARVVVIKLGTVSGVMGDVKLHVWLPPAAATDPSSGKYPNVPPLAFVANGSMSSPARLAAAAGMAAQCADKCGAPFLYELAVWASEEVAASIAQYAARLSSHILGGSGSSGSSGSSGDKATAGAKAPSVPPPAPGAPGKAGARGRNSSGRKFNRSTHDSGAALDKIRASLRSKPKECVPLIVPAFLARLSACHLASPPRCCPPAPSGRPCSVCAAACPPPRSKTS